MYYNFKRVNKGIGNSKSMSNKIWWILSSYERILADVFIILYFRVKSLKDIITLGSIEDNTVKELTKYSLKKLDENIKSIM